MTEESLESNALPLKAVKIVQMLIEFGYPKDSSEVSGWLKNVKLLQTFLSNCWQNDPSGKIMVQCLTLLYTIIALNLSPVGPAVWSILDLVVEEKISEFVEGILSDPSTNDNTKVQNVLTAMIEGLGQFGPYTPRLQDWVFAIVQGLEARKNFTVLIDVSENVIQKLMQLLLIPLYRPLIYPAFRQFLYPVVTPHVFYKILDKVPGTLNLLEKDLDCEETGSISLDFAALIKTLLIRFPPKPGYEAKYNLIKMALAKFPETTFKHDSMVLWDPKQNSASSSWIPEKATSDSEDCSPKTLYKGLMNQGNTCFMNSVLQILYMTTRGYRGGVLKKKMLSAEEEQGPESQKETAKVLLLALREGNVVHMLFRKELFDKELDSSEKAASDLQQLFAFMQESNRTVLVPNGVIDSTFPNSFRRGHQQDSSEYLIYLLDILHESEHKILRRKRPTTSANKTAERKREGNGDFGEEETTLVERLFGGVTMSTTICSFCKRSFPKNDNFRNLHLPIPDDYKSCDLQELIDVSLQPEELTNDNMYDCANCGTKRNATRKHAIVKAPQHLILTLKLFRFDPVRKQRLKLHSRLNKVNSVELPVYNSSQFQTDMVTYDLKGVVLHSGSSLDGGHYFSSAVDQTGQWYTFNDSVVTTAKYEWNSGGGTPYILILRQSGICDPPASPLPSNLQLLVNRDNQKLLTEKRYQQRTFHRKKDYDDDWDDAPPNNGSLGGPGPSLVF